MLTVSRKIRPSLNSRYAIGMMVETAFGVSLWCAAIMFLAWAMFDAFARLVEDGGGFDDIAIVVVTILCASKCAQAIQNEIRLCREALGGHPPGPEATSRRNGRGRT